MKYDLPSQHVQRAGRGWLFGIVALVLGGVLGFLLAPQFGVRSAREPPAGPVASATLLNHEELTELAKTLERNRLFGEAARAWEQAARLQPPVGARKAEVVFRIGKNLSLAHEYERAIAYLLAAEAMDREQRWQSSINRMVLEGLSALGREDVRARQAARRIALDEKGEKAPAIVAEIGAEPITEADLDSFSRDMVTQQLSMQRQYMSAEDFEEAVQSSLDRFEEKEGRQRILQMYLSRELLYREALAAGLAEDEAVRRRLIDTRRQILIDAFLQDYVEKNLHIDDTDLENAYQANKADYVEPEAFKVEAIVVETDEAKEKVSAALEAGTGFAELRDEFSIVKPEGDKPESGASNVGQPDPFDRWITRNGWVPLVADSRAGLAHILNLEEGEVGAKWLEGTGGKWLRFRLVDHRPPRQLTLDECRDRVARDLRGRKKSDLLQQLQGTLQRKFDVVIHETGKQE